jgi:predicted DNA-binding transcriptional regulator AlpA
MGTHLNTAQAAEWLGLEESTLRDWRSDRKGPPYIKISARCIRYAMEDLVKWRNDRRHVPSVSVRFLSLPRVSDES